MLERQREREEAVRVMLAQPGLANYQHCTFDNFDPEPDKAALARSRQWVNVLCQWFDAGKPRGGPSIFWTSERSGEDAAPGSGKTHLAAASLRSLAEAGHARVYKHERSGEQWTNLAFVTSADLISQIRSTYNRDSPRTPEEVLGRYSWADVLILDDVGTEPGGEDTTSKLFQLVERRMDWPTGYTSNYTTEKLAKRNAEWAKLVSRMRSHMRGAILRGPDRRKPAGDPWSMWT